MALQGDAAMVLFYDFEGASADHDDWHTYEHMHERLSIPGFLRGTRWVAGAGGPRNLIVYEVAGLDVLTSEPYLARLNSPTPWTASSMSRFRGMTRGFCAVAASAGYGLGMAARVVRFNPGEGAESRLQEGLARKIAQIVVRRGMASAVLFTPAAQPPMTKEQAIRGKDRDAPWVLLASGYEAGDLERACDEHLAVGKLAQLGASNVEASAYALQYTVTSAEVARTAPHPQRIPKA